MNYLPIPVQRWSGTSMFCKYGPRKPVKIRSPLSHLILPFFSFKAILNKGHRPTLWDHGIFPFSFQRGEVLEQKAHEIVVELSGSTSLWERCDWSLYLMCTSVRGLHVSTYTETAKYAGRPSTVLHFISHLRCGRIGTQQGAKVQRNMYGDPFDVFTNKLVSCYFHHVYNKIIQNMFSTYSRRLSVDGVFSWSLLTVSI